MLNINNKTENKFFYNVDHGLGKAQLGQTWLRWSGFGLKPMFATAQLCQKLTSIQNWSKVTQK